MSRVLSVRVEDVFFFELAWSSDSDNSDNIAADGNRIRSPFSIKLVSSSFESVINHVQIITAS